MSERPFHNPMHHEVQVFDTLDDLSTAAARYVVGTAREAVQASGAFHFAVSGGRSPWQMFAKLTGMDMPWDNTVIWQVDERVAPADDPDRNLAHLRQSLAGRSTEILPMPVEDTDLDAAARAYGEELPARLDLVHLGIGPDGHTASLVPGDAVLEVTDRPVAVTAGEYQGRRRMTLTYPGLARARQLLWLVTGEDKRDALDKLLAGDPSIPAGRVVAEASLVMADRAAHPG
jgi:6-phosphogluconolactonase